MAVEENGGNGGAVSWHGGKRIFAGLNVSMSLLLAICVVVMANYLSARYFFVRRDIGALKFYDLSEKTRSLLASLRGRISVYVVFRDDGETGVGGDIMALLNEYRYCANSVGGPRIRIERIDPDRDLSRCEEMRARYGIADAGVVIFDVGGRSKCVPESEIVDYEYEAGPEGTPPRVKKANFRGEEAFSSAILSVTQEQRPVVYFVKGHGEHDVADFAQRTGYSDVARCLRADDLAVQSAFLTEIEQVPQDCALLVIAGPEKPFHAAEVSAVGRYLAGRGSVLLLTDAGRTTGLESLLEEWGVRLTADKVVEKTIVLSYRDKRVVSLPATESELYVRRYGVHPVTKGLGGVTTVMYMPRSVLPTTLGQHGRGPEQLDRPRATILAMSSENGWGETDMTQDPAVFNAGVDTQGPVPLAAAVERGSTGGMNVDLKPTRMVVMGDSDFAANGRLSGGNRDFFMNAVNWLIERESLIGVGPKAYRNIYLKMDGRRTVWLFVMLAGAIPAVVAAAGAAVWMSRSK